MIGQTNKQRNRDYSSLQTEILEMKSVSAINRHMPYTSLISQRFKGYRCESGLFLINGKSLEMNLTVP